MLRQLRPAAIAVLVFTILTGALYPLAVTGVGQVIFGHEADGSEFTIDGQVRASELLAQPFENDEWFHPRPSAVGYDASSTGGSNLGPLNQDLLATFEARADVYREENDLDTGVPVPIDAVTASGSGVDPHISVRNAKLQAPRVAEARDLSLDEVVTAIEKIRETRSVGFLGEQRVNVVKLNAELLRMEG